MEEVQPAFPQEFNWVVNPSFIMEKMASEDDLDQFLDALKFPPSCTPILDQVLNSKNIFLTLEKKYLLDDVAVLGLKGLRKERLQLMIKRSKEGDELVYALTNGWNKLVESYTVGDEEDTRDDLKLQVWASFLEGTKLLMCIFIDDSSAEEQQEVPSTSTLVDIQTSNNAAGLSKMRPKRLEEEQQEVPSTSTLVDIQTSNNNAGLSKMRPKRKGKLLREGEFIPTLLLHELRKHLPNLLNDLICLEKKTLSASDAETHRNRLYLPCPSELKSRMTAKEIQDAGMQAGLEVLVIDHKGKEWEVKLRFWKPSFALTGDNWKLIITDLGLEKSMRADVWIFRGPPISTKLCFALSFKKVDEEDEVEEEDPSDSLEEEAEAGGVELCQLIFQIGVLILLSHLSIPGLNAVLALSSSPTVNSDVHSVYVLHSTTLAMSSSSYCLNIRL